MPLVKLLRGLGTRDRDRYGLDKKKDAPEGIEVSVSKDAADAMVSRGLGTVVVAEIKAVPTSDIEADKAKKTVKDKA